MENLLEQIKSDDNKILILNNPSHLKTIKFLISHFAEKSLNSLNYKTFVDLALIYFKDNIYSNERKILMETIFKYIQPRANYLEGLQFFAEICQSLTNVNTFFEEMAFAVFFAYQCGKFDTIKNILNYHFLKLETDDYISFKYFCMYFFCS